MLLAAESPLSEWVWWLASVDTFLSLVAAFFAGWAWLKTTELIRTNREARERKEAQIAITLSDQESNPPRQWTAPYRPRRDQLSRAELMGILGVYAGGPRYELSQIRETLESGELDRVLNGEQNEFRIPCTTAEFDGFQRLISAATLEQTA